MCAMNESSSIQQAAMQPLFLCPVCLRKLKKALKFNIVHRYQEMLQLCKELYREVSNSYRTAQSSERLELLSADRKPVITRAGVATSVKDLQQSDGEVSTIAAPVYSVDGSAQEEHMLPHNLHTATYFGTHPDGVEQQGVDPLPYMHPNSAPCATGQVSEDTTGAEHQLHSFCKAIAWLEQSIADAKEYVQHHLEMYKARS